MKARVVAYGPEPKGWEVTEPGARQGYVTPESWEVIVERGARLEFTIPDDADVVAITNTGDDWIYAGGESLRDPVNGMPVAPGSPPVEIHGFTGTLVLLSAA